MIRMPHPGSSAEVGWVVGRRVLMGTVTSRLKVGDRRVPASMFNFGMS